MQVPLETMLSAGNVVLGKIAPKELELPVYAGSLILAVEGTGSGRGYR